MCKFVSGAVQLQEIKYINLIFQPWESRYFSHAIIVFLLMRTYAITKHNDYL
jgi:hypothetical protein